MNNQQREDWTIIFCHLLKYIQVYNKDFDILCFTESWLDPNVNDSELMLNNFNIPFRHDRQDRAGGGVIVYTKDHLYCKRRHDLEIHGIECVWFEIIEKSQKYLIGTFYRPPNCLNNTWNLIDESIELAIDTQIKISLLLAILMKINYTKLIPKLATYLQTIISTNLS